MQDKIKIIASFYKKIPCTGGTGLQQSIVAVHFANLKNSDLPIISAFYSLLNIHILQHYLAKLINIAVDLIPVALTLH